MNQIGIVIVRTINQLIVLLEVLLDGYSVVLRAPAVALLESLEVVLVAVAATEVEHLAGALFGVEVKPT